MIPEAAVEAAAKRIGPAVTVRDIVTILESAAPHMLDQVEKELRDAKRMVALLILKAGGAVTIGHNAVVSLSDDTEIHMAERPLAGDWVISAKVPTRG